MAGLLISPPTPSDGVRAPSFELHTAMMLSSSGTALFSFDGGDDAADTSTASSVFLHDVTADETSL